MILQLYRRQPCGVRKVVLFYSSSFGLFFRKQNDPTGHLETKFFEVLFLDIIGLFCHWSTVMIHYEMTPRSTIDQRTSYQYLVRVPGTRGTWNEPGHPFDVRRVAMMFARIANSLFSRSRGFRFSMLKRTSEAFHHGVRPVAPTH